MTSEEISKMTDKQDTLGEFIDKFPLHKFPGGDSPELLYKGPDRYAGLDREKSGTWRTINSGGAPMALAWTDWEDGFDIILLHPGEVSEQLSGYPTSAKALEISASWAYTSLESYIESLDPELSVGLGPQQRGPLSGAQDYSGDVPSYGTFEDVEED